MLVTPRTDFGKELSFRTHAIHTTISLINNEHFFNTRIPGFLYSS